jgi:hypothetical protein
VETAVRAASPNDSLAGDTLVLIGIGSESLQAALESNPPCNARSIPALQRFMFHNDSMYRGFSIERPGCRDPLVASSDTAEWESRYEVHGDTLKLYTGDGDEVFASYTGRLFPDSVTALASDEATAWRYARRRAARH